MGQTTTKQNTEARKPFLEYVLGELLSAFAYKRGKGVSASWNMQQERII